MERQKVELVKELLKRIHQGADPEQLKKEFASALVQITPAEIVLIEQQLVREGVPVQEILELCDFHVALFRNFLASRELEGVPEGHPLDLLLKENELLLKWSEQLSLLARIIESSRDEELEGYFNQLKAVLQLMRSIRIHYRKVQMLIFPYLERRGITAVPRVLWAREDSVVFKLRELLKKAGGKLSPGDIRALAREAAEIAREVSELVFRENKILYPAAWSLFSEGEWAAIAEEAESIGYLVKAEKKWVPRAEPVLPYQVEPSITPEQWEKLPPEFRTIGMQKLEPDTYKLVRSGDLDLGTGFLFLEEIKGIFKALPVEITFADAEDRVRFFTEGYARAFVRTKTILGRRLLFCHPPRLEGFVKRNVEALKRGEFNYREFWTRVGDRIVRVFVAAVRDSEGRYIGTLEVVEDLTEVVTKPEEVLKKVIVL